MDIDLIMPMLNARFGWAVGLTVKSAALTKEGFSFTFEDTDQRVEILLLPKLYPEGRLVIDAVNDLTIQVEVRRQSLSGSEAPRSEKIEIPYSAWFGDSYM